MHKSLFVIYEGETARLELSNALSLPDPRSPKKL